jgi:hypothetical protein
LSFGLLLLLLAALLYLAVVISPDPLEPGGVLGRLLAPPRQRDVRAGRQRGREFFVLRGASGSDCRSARPGTLDEIVADDPQTPNRRPVMFNDPELPLEARILLAARACGRNRNRRPGGD